MPDAPSSPSLAAALEKRGISLPPDQVELLTRYCRELWEWNEKLNLTRHVDFDRFVARDVIDSIQLSEELDADERVLDIGSGGGGPGLIIAILRPDLHVSLSESVAKKARALDAIVNAIGLNVPVHHARAESLMPDLTFDTLTARAVAPMAKILTWLRGSWGAFNRLLLIKGPGWVDERRAAREAGLMKPLSLRRIRTWPLEGTGSESVLLEIRPKDQA